MGKMRSKIFKFSVNDDRSSAVIVRHFLVVVKIRPHALQVTFFFSFLVTAMKDFFGG